MVFLVESIEVGDLVLWWATRGPHMLISFLRPDRDLPGWTPGSTPDSQVIEGLSCRNAESPHLPNRTVSCRNARMNQAQYTKKQHWYSGKHKRHGGAVQTVAAPDGELLWVSGVLPGRTVDITAARRFKIADKVLEFLGLLADLGYIGLHPDVITGYKRKRGEKTLSEAKKAANRAQASVRCLGERANAQLKCWRVLTCDFRGNPRQLTTVVKAVQTLQYLIRDPFGTDRIGIAS